VALEIPDEIRGEVARRAEAARRELPKARWVRAGSLHLTLAFLGETEPDRLPRLAEHLAPAFAASPPFVLQLVGGGTFPPNRPARVAWAGLEADPELARLRARVAAALVEAVGFEPDRRGYSPHLTLARCSRPWRREEIERFTRHFRGALGAPFPIHRGVLFESRLGPGGARYREVQVYPLGEGGPRGAEEAVP
jgi:2'-5' RNA ligase